MTTCRDIITLGLQMARIVPVGREPKDREASTGLTILQGMYDGYFADGLFGSLTDVYAQSAYTAKEGERVSTDSAAITIPATIDEAGTERAPRELSAIVVVTGGTALNYVYSNGAWEQCSGLALGSPAPLASRSAAGLAALFAKQYCEVFGGALGMETQRMALQFKSSLMHKLGTNQPAVEYY